MDFAGFATDKALSLQPEIVSEDDGDTTPLALENSLAPPTIYPIIHKMFEPAKGDVNASQSASMASPIREVISRLPS